MGMAGRAFFLVFSGTAPGCGGGDEGAARKAGL